MKIFFLTFGSVFLLFGCAAKPINVTVGDTEFSESAKAFKISPESAKIYFFNGRQGSTFSMKADMPGGAILLINNREVGQIDKQDVLVANIHPKTYTFSWKYPSDDSKHIELTKDIKAGEVIILEPFWDLGGIGFGLVGALLAPPEYKISESQNKNIIQGKRVVRANTCPVEICIQD